MVRIINPAMKAAIEPTERSSPPAVMTKVMPTAMIPMKADLANTFVMLAIDRKFSFIPAPMATSTRSATIGPST